MAPHTLLLCFHSLAYSLLIAYVILSKWRVYSLLIAYVILSKWRVYSLLIAYVILSKWWVYSLLIANVQMAGVDTIWELHTLPVINS